MKYYFTSLFVIASFYCHGQAKADLSISQVADAPLRADTSDLFWKAGRWVALPHREGKPAYESRFKILYSSTGIYCLFYCQDKTITSTLREDFANLYNEDVVEAFFWTDTSYPVYFEYELSPHNFELPILVPNFKGTFLGWLPWHYEGDRRTKHEAVIQNDNSWVAAFFIPYTLLTPLNNVPPKKGDVWHCNFYRIDYDQGGSSWSWQRTGPNFHDINAFGKIRFE